MFFTERTLTFLIADNSSAIRYGLRSLLMERFKDASLYLEDGVEGFLARLFMMRFDLVIVSEKIACQGKQQLSKEVISASFPRQPTILFLDSAVNRCPISGFVAAGYRGVLNKNLILPSIIKAIEKIVFEDVAFVYGTGEELVWVDVDNDLDMIISGIGKGLIGHNIEHITDV